MVLSILNQMIYLFAFIFVGFLLSRFRFIPENSTKVLSKFENAFFVPAMILSTFIKDCSVEKLRANWQLVLLGTAVGLVFVLFSCLFVRLCYKEKHVKNVTTYSVAFSNFAFMGYALVGAVFSDIYVQYILFTLPLWFMIYLWGIPVLLIGSERVAGEKQTFLSNFKSFLNPMFASFIVAVLLTLSGLNERIPAVAVKIISDAGFCMSPIAMLLTGVTVGRLNLRSLMKRWQIYAISFVKLLIFPLLFIAVFAFVPQNTVVDETFLTCGLIFACMPTGLNAVVIPAAYGKDTSDAACLALVTHALAVGTIPLTYMLFQNIVL